MFEKCFLKNCLFSLLQFSGHMGSSSADMRDMHGSPQAVFTSFKLPKPGNMDMHMPMQGSPFGLGSRFPMPFPTTTTTPSGGLSSSPRVMTAPLGGLPAVDSQMAARQQQQQQHQHDQAMKMLSQQHQQQQQQLQQQQQHSRHLSSPDRLSDDGDDCRSVSPKSIPTTPKSGGNRNSEGDVKQEGNSSDESPPKIQGLIKARGTYYPLTAFPTSMPQGPVMHRDDSPPRTELQPSKFN